MVEELNTMRGGRFTRVSGDVWSVLLDQAENEAYDNINLFKKEMESLPTEFCIVGSLTCLA